MKNRFNIVVGYTQICQCCTAIRFGVDTDDKGNFCYTLECANCGTLVKQAVVDTPITAMPRKEEGPRAFVRPTQAKGRA